MELTHASLEASNYSFTNANVPKIICVMERLCFYCLICNQKYYFTRRPNIVLCLIYVFIVEIWQKIHLVSVYIRLYERLSVCNSWLFTTKSSSKWLTVFSIKLYTDEHIEYRQIDKHTDENYKKIIFSLINVSN